MTTPSVPDLKPRSREVTDGLERAAARGMLRAVGMTDDDWEKPQIGVGSSWNEITPCNLSLDRLAKAAKDGVHAAGGFPMEFGTISVSDGISMGHEGMHYSLVSREVIADSVETVFGAERLGGAVLLAGCDKSEPAMLMAAARLDVAAVFLYAGSILPGRVGDREVTIIDAFEAVGACARGLITRAEVDAIERAICPGEGACGGMYTANTMASAAEALGMSLPGSAAPPAVDRRRDGSGWLDQRGPAPDGDRTRGGRRPRPRRLQPDRRPGSTPGRRQAVRLLRDDRHRSDRRRAGGHARPARRRPVAWRVPHGHGQDHGREPGDDRPTRPRWKDHPFARRPHPPNRWADGRSRFTVPGRRRRQDRGLRRDDLRGHCSRLRRRAGRHGRGRRRHGRRRGRGDQPI